MREPREATLSCGVVLNMATHTRLAHSATQVPLSHRLLEGEAGGFRRLGCETRREDFRGGWDPSRENGWGANLA